MCPHPQDILPFPSLGSSLRRPTVASCIACSSSLLQLLGPNQTVKQPTLLGTESSAVQEKRSPGNEFCTLQQPNDWEGGIEQRGRIEILNTRSSHLKGEQNKRRPPATFKCSKSKMWRLMKLNLHQPDYLIR